MTSSPAWVQAGDRFVGEDGARALHQRACDGHPLRLPAGEMIRGAFGEMAQLDLLQAVHRVVANLAPCQRL
jgi:hypothetical protein